MLADKNNSCHEPILEDYDRPFLEDYHRKEGVQCDSEAESEDDGCRGTEDHWSPLLDLSYHYFIGSLLLGPMKEMDLASLSATCQFAPLVTPVEHESITTHVWRDQVVFRCSLDESYYVPPYFPKLQSQCSNKVSK